MAGRAASATPTWTSWAYSSTPHLGEKGSPKVRRQLRFAIVERVPPDVLALYVAIYAVRYASWAISSSMEREVHLLGRRLLQEFSS